MTPPPNPSPSDPRPWPPGGRRPGQATDEQARARAGRRLVAQSAALLAMLGAFTLVLPWKLLALGCALGAITLGVLAWRAGRGAGAGVVRASAAVGIVLALLGGFAASLPLLAWQETTRLEDCVRSAVTARAQQACTDEFTRSVQDRAGEPAA